MTFRKYLALLCVLVLTATALWASPAGEDESDAAMEMEKEMVTDPSTGEMVTAPRYGGTLTFVKTGTSASADIVVPGGWAEALIDPVLEKLGIADSTAPRDQFDSCFCSRQTTREGHWRKAGRSPTQRRWSSMCARAFGGMTSHR